MALIRMVTQPFVTYIAMLGAGLPVTTIRILIQLILLSSIALAQPASNKDVGALIADLKSSNPDMRWGAADALVQKGDLSVLPLIEVFRNSDSDTARIVVDILAKIGKPSVDILIRSAKDTSPVVRRGVVDALSRIQDPRVIEILVGAVKDPSPEVREIAVKSMLKIKDSRATENLIEALKDDNRFVREKAIEVLGNIGDSRAVDPIIAQLNDKDPRIRKIASDALWEMRSLPELMSLAVMLKTTVLRYKALTNDVRRYVDTDSLPRYGVITEEQYREVKDINSKIHILLRIYPFIIRSGEFESEGVLIAIFNRYGNKQMADDFLNCGNSRLMQAAYKWIQDNLHSLTMESATVGPRWGRK